MESFVIYTPILGRPNSILMSDPFREISVRYHPQSNHANHAKLKILGILN